MSCDAVAFTAMLWLAAASPAPAPVQSATAGAPLSVAGEPLFADIVRRAGALRGDVAALRQVSPATPLPSLADFSARLNALAELDMQGHLTLKARGTDGDLKCILRGISQDLPVKLKVVAEAASGRPRDLALRELDYLLRDNIEVITSPHAPPA
jgi:hypothetical protein